MLLALAQLNTVNTRQPSACNPLFSKLKARFANYSLLGVVYTIGIIFCTRAPTSNSLVVGQAF